jgi:hypothetical protein
MRHRSAFDPRWLLLGLCLGAAPAAADEIYRWTDADGNVHFGNRKPAGNDAETVQGGQVNRSAGDAAAPAGAPAAQERDAKVEDSKARLRRLQRENKKSQRKGSKPVLLRADGVTPENRPDPTKSEKWCQATYGKSCADLENWREKAIADCERKNSAHCDDPKWIDRKEPRTLEQIREIKEENRDRARARYNRARAKQR